MAAGSKTNEPELPLNITDPVPENVASPWRVPFQFAPPTESDAVVPDVSLNLYSWRSVTALATTVTDSVLVNVPSTAFKVAVPGLMPVMIPPELTVNIEGLLELKTTLPGSEDGTTPGSAVLRSTLVTLG
jgi:hypothetical protein